MKRHLMSQKDRHRYDEILYLPHHVSSVHPPMPVRDRAAQFAPFAALTGHGEAVKETARLTEKKIELDEDCKEALDRKLSAIQEMAKELPSIRVTYFVPDGKKDGGTYKEAVGKVKKIDGYRRWLLLGDGRKIPLDEILEIEEEKG